MVILEMHSRKGCCAAKMSTRLRPSMSFSEAYEAAYLT